MSQEENSPYTEFCNNKVKIVYSDGDHTATIKGVVTDIIDNKFFRIIKDNDAVVFIPLSPDKIFKIEVID